MGVVANFISFPAVKTFENRLRFDKVTESLKVELFLRHSVEMCNIFLFSQSFNLKIGFYNRPSKPNDKIRYRCQITGASIPLRHWSKSTFTLRSLPLPFLPFVPLEVGPINPARGSGERCKLPSGVWGRAPAEVKFGAF